MGSESVGHNSGSRGPIGVGFKMSGKKGFKDLALVPINQRIVAVEPGISKHKCDGRVQLSNEKRYHKDITSRVTNSQIHSMGNP